LAFNLFSFGVWTLILLELIKNKFIFQ